MKFPDRPFGYTTFCDDLRVEIGGQITLVGTYVRPITVPAPPPYIIPKLVAFVTYAEPFLFERAKRITIKVFNTDGTVIAETTIPELKSDFPGLEDLPNEDRVLRTIFPFVFSPIVIQTRGDIKVRAYRDNDEIRLGAIRVNFEPQQQQG